MDQKTFAWRLKALSTEGSFTGMASTYNNTDLGGDQIAPGAFTKSIQSQGRGITLLWQHRASEPIGLGKLSDQPGGLQVDGSLLMTDPVAQRAYEHLKAGTVRGLSIGYDPIKSSPTPDGGRLLSEVRLWEISVVTFPMNERAVVTAIKSLADVEQLLTTIQSAELSRAEITQLKSIDRQLKSLLATREPPEDTSALLAEFQHIDAQLKQLLA